MVFYSFAWSIALFVSAPWWLWKMATTRKYREGLGERLGRVPPRLLGNGEGRATIWIHAVSVGEVIAVSRLVGELQARSPGHRVVVSTTTATGQRVARDRFGTESVFYYPLDFGWPVRSYLRALTPKLLVLAETEFWPRMLFECRRANIPVAVVNARISDRSFLGIFACGPCGGPFCAGYRWPLAQSGEDVGRLQAIGVPAECIRLAGNLKYDIRAPADLGIAAEIRQSLPPSARIMVCGSTLEGEERMLLDAWPAVVAAVPEARMILAPRHPERFSPVAVLLERSGLPWSRRSHWQRASNLAPGSVLLLDSIGELAAIYSLASAAFVGGSLVSAGGHNPLEPAQFGVPVLMGPNYANFREIVDKLRAHNAIWIIDPDRISLALANSLRGDDASSAMGARAREVFQAEAGATRRTADALQSLLTTASAKQSPAGRL